MPAGYARRCSRDGLNKGWAVVDIVPILDEGLGNASWLVDLGDGSALVVDPERDPRPYLRSAGERGLRLRWVAETHLHADFVSGARELAEGGDMRLVAPAAARLAVVHEPLGDGAEVDVGGLALRALATPGHTPEHVAYLLVDGERPVALFSGGTLIVGGVARPDLIAPEETEPLARAAWRSITRRLLPLPDDLSVHPTHGGGSFCSAGAGDRRTTTIGQERTTNPLLQAADEDAFVQQLFGGLGTFPTYFLKLREVNRAGPRLYGADTPMLPPLSPARVGDHLEDGGVLIDVRPVQAFAAGHVPGSLSIALRAQFGVWLGWLVDELDAALAFVLADDQDRDDLVRQCLNVGYENLVGELEGGVEAWREAGGATSAVELLDRPVADRQVLDVRQTSEWETGHIPGATHVELGELATAPGRAPRGSVVTHCMHGQRSMTAASVLERAGHDDVAVYPHGPDEWSAAGPEGLGG
ncbi:MAG: rhodanese-like domain-containing protein [Actinomycetota bacterium]|nr:rhodanese-like domain-containing protein [Actinomycetota bacterium]